MRVYVDSSALLKRIVVESGSTALISRLAHHAGAGDSLLCSSLGWIEVSRALRRQVAGDDSEQIDDWCDLALSGVLERTITADVVALSRRLIEPYLRSLDAIHLATALVLDVNVLVAYDARLIDAAKAHGLVTASP